MNYNTRPEINTESVVSSLTSISFGWKQFNLTRLARNWMKYLVNEGGYSCQYGFALKAADPTLASKHFSSHLNTAYEVSIIINYNSDTSLVPRTYFLRNKANNMYLSMNPDHPSELEFREFWSAPFMVWTVTSDGNDAYRLYTWWMTGSGYLARGATLSDGRSKAAVISEGYTSIEAVKNADGTYRLMQISPDGNTWYALGRDLLWSTYTARDEQKWWFETGKLPYLNFQADTAGYDREAAKAYAESYGPVYQEDTDYDTPGYLSLAGKNCTNFVSQCLRAGGMEEKGDFSNRESDSAWHYNTTLGQYTGSYTWGAAENFARHWGVDENGNGQQRCYRTVVYFSLADAYQDWDYLYEFLQEGDVLQLYDVINDNESGLQHSMIVHRKTDKKSSVHDVFYAQHTSNKSNVSLKDYLNGNSTKTDEGLIVHFISNN